MCKISVVLKFYFNCCCWACLCARTCAFEMEFINFLHCENFWPNIHNEWNGIEWNETTRSAQKIGTAKTDYVNVIELRMRMQKSTQIINTLFTEWNNINANTNNERNSNDLNLGCSVWFGSVWHMKCFCLHFCTLCANEWVCVCLLTANWLQMNLEHEVRSTKYSILLYVYIKPNERH